MTNVIGKRWASSLFATPRSEHDGGMSVIAGETGRTQAFEEFRTVKILAGAYMGVSFPAR